MHPKFAAQYAFLTALFTVCVWLLILLAGATIRIGTLSGAINSVLWPPTLQSEIVDMAYRDQVIAEELRNVLELHKGVARVRLGQIHNGQAGPTGTGLLRYDVTHEETAVGHVRAPLAQNEPLSNWSGTLPDLLQNRCSTALGIQSNSNLQRYRDRGVPIKMRVSCPVTDPATHNLLGAIGILWDDDDPVPDAAELAAIDTLCLGIGSRIATVLATSRSRL